MLADPNKFILVWNSAHLVEEAAIKLGIEPRTAISRASELRRAGHKLKRMPRSKVKNQLSINTLMEITQAKIILYECKIERLRSFLQNLDEVCKEFADNSDEVLSLQKRKNARDAAIEILRTFGPLTVRELLERLHKRHVRVQENSLRTTLWRDKNLFEKTETGTWKLKEVQPCNDGEHE